ncbi:MAG TPA: CBS domain-containing protein, partial [Holophagaceae bacterium]|nr:CBS domain-containing protein [Holophagaceae bacterium]
ASGLRLADLARRVMVAIPPDRTLREAAELMAQTRADVLVVTAAEDPSRLLGVLTLRDLLQAHGEHLESAGRREAFEVLPAGWKLPGA